MVSLLYEASRLQRCHVDNKQWSRRVRKRIWLYIVYNDILWLEKLTKKHLHLKLPNMITLRLGICDQTIEWKWKSIVFQYSSVNWKFEKW
jgi:hypothetical protein